MRLETRFTLRQLVWCTLGSSFLLPPDLCAVILAKHLGHLPSSFHAWCLAMILTVALPFGGCVLASLSGIRALRRGLMDDLWASGEIEHIAKLLQSPALSRTTYGLIWVGLLVCFGSVLLPSTGHTASWGGLIYFFTAPSLTRSELLKLFAPPKPAQTSALSLANLKPIVSSRWGEHGAGNSI